MSLLSLNSSSTEIGAVGAGDHEALVPPDARSVARRLESADRSCERALVVGDHRRGREIGSELAREDQHEVLLPASLHG